MQETHAAVEEVHRDLTSLRRAVPHAEVRGHCTHDLHARDVHRQHVVDEEPRLATHARHVAAPAHGVTRDRAEGPLDVGKHYVEREPVGVPEPILIRVIASCQILRAWALLNGLSSAICSGLCCGGRLKAITVTATGTSCPNVSSGLPSF